MSSVRRRAGIALIALGCGSLWGCEKQPESGDHSETGVVEPVKMSSELIDMPCGSLEPLLSMLPPAQTVDDMPEAYRHCDPGAFGVSAGFGQKGDGFSLYEFTVKVLDGNSHYAVSPLNPAGAEEDARALLTQLLDSSGELFRSMLAICEGYVRNPIVPDGRNPLVVPVNGVDVCVRDDLDPNREIWNAFAASGGLGFHLTLRGVRAGAIETTDAARARRWP
jgi:hypothetical protein